jgi:hypothetical protein
VLDKGKALAQIGGSNERELGEWRVTVNSFLHYRGDRSDLRFLGKQRNPIRRVPVLLLGQLTTPMAAKNSMYFLSDSKPADLSGQGISCGNTVTFLMDQGDSAVKRGEDRGKGSCDRGEAELLIRSTKLLLAARRTFLLEFDPAIEFAAAE